MTREDVIPRWFSRLLAEVEPRIHEFRIHGVPQYTSKTPQFVAKRVCEKCNSGWMSTIQSDAKPIFTRIWQQGRGVLATSDQEILVRWAFMSTLTAQLAARPRECRIPRGIFEEFRRTQQIPSVTFGLITSVNLYDVTSGFHFRDTVTRKRRNDLTIVAGSETRDGYQAIVQLGSIAIQLSGQLSYDINSEPDDFRWSVPREIMKRSAIIWPPKGPVYLPTPHGYAQSELVSWMFDSTGAPVPGKHGDKEPADVLAQRLWSHRQETVTVVRQRSSPEASSS